MRVLFVYPNNFLTTSVPLGIAYMSAILKEAGHEVRCFDSTFHDTSEAQNLMKESLGQAPKTDYGMFDEYVCPGDDLLRDFRRNIIEFHPDVIAFSVVEDAWELSTKLLEETKGFKIPVVVGGVFPTFASEKVRSAFPNVTICQGEGENYILNYVNDQDIYITNLVDINTIPVPDYDIFSPAMLYRPMSGKLRKTLMVETQRGCPYNCTFCNSRAQKELYGKEFYRRKSTNRLYAELNCLTKKYQPEFIYWVGDSFLSMPQREWKEFVEMYKEFRLPFWMNTRPETITKERVEDLGRIGCIRCNIGIEHGDPFYRKSVINRNISNDVIIKACQCFEYSKIELVTNNIIGWPLETRTQLQATIDLNKQVRDYTTSASAFICMPYHGTQIREYAVENRCLDNDVICSSIWQMPKLTNPHIADQELMDIQKNFNEIVNG
jgi:anaerobic magnesium-protoporphyrin IX monomethyl ester cyclase